MGSAGATHSKGQSLWKDAWRRLKKNKAAMVGLVVTVFMTTLAVGADWLLPFEADYGQLWVRAQPPGFSHPAVLAENRFDVDKKVVVPMGIPDVVAGLLESDGTITYTAVEFEEAEYSVRTRRGKVARNGIRRTKGAMRVPRLVVEGEGAYAQLIDADGKPGPKLSGFTLDPGKPLPELLKGKGRRLILRVRAPRTPEPETIAVTLKGGRCTAITRDGEERKELRLQGRFVRKVEKNGETVSLKHWLGTDLAGRDVLTRVIYGGRISLMVGAVATIVSVLIGVIYGAVAGYLAQRSMSRWALVGLATGVVFGGVAFWVSITLPGEEEPEKWMTWRGALPISILGFAAWVAAFTRFTRHLPEVLRKAATTVGEFMMRIVDIAYALPYMFLVILLMISFGRDIFTLFVALGLVQWLTMARIVRGQTLSLKEKEFVEAAEMSGTSHLGILFRHIIPNTLGVVVVYSTLTIPAVILQESFLAFIGLTVEFQGRTLDSWGSLVNQGREALTTTGGNWWVLLFPSLAMAVTLFSLNFFGDGLRDALDPQMKGRS